MAILVCFVYDVVIYGGNMDLQLVEFVQSFRTEFLDLFFSLITELGDETVFIVVVGLIYWTMSKSYGYRYAMVFLSSVVLNETLKELIARPRPYTNPSVTSVTPQTSGYAFPSGHAQNSTIQAWLLNEGFGHVKRWVRPALITIVILVSFSRVYLGQHYLSDVIAGIAVASLLYVLYRYLATKVSWTTSQTILYASPLLLILLVLFPEKNLWISVAGMIGGTIGYVLEARLVQFDVKATLPIQGLKFLIGISVALGLQEGLKLVLPYSTATEFVTLVLDFIRYALLVMWVTLGAPALFKVLFQQKTA
jgi:membrane-associated phospholipid phosphatase